MGNPLFSAVEMAEWEAKKTDARVQRPDDTVYHPNSHSPYNQSAYARVQAIEHAWRVERLRRIRNRPDDLLNMLLVAFHERGSQPILWDEIYAVGFGERLDVANTPELRRHVHTVLLGLKSVPRSWAKSATTRFFRGIGKQGEPPWSEKPGAGVLSKDFGWKTFEAEWYVELFYQDPLNGVFFADDSINPYSEEGHEIDEEGGNRFAATTKSRDDEFFDLLIGILEARGLAQGIDKPNIPPPKPHKAKTFSPGDVITSRNLRDLPEGAHVRWTVVEYAHNHLAFGLTEFEAAEHAYEFVLVSREKGSLQIRYVMQGKAFAPRGFDSANLYKTSFRWNEVQATYLGQWAGEKLDVETKDWKPKSTRKVRRRREGSQYPYQFVAI